MSVVNLITTDMYRLLLEIPMIPIRRLPCHCRRDYVWVAPTFPSYNGGTLLLYNFLEGVL